MHRFALLFALIPGFLFGDLVLQNNVTISGNVQAVAGSLAAPDAATNVFPTEGASYMAASTTVTWTYGAGATSFNLYLDKTSEHNPPITLVYSGTNLSYAATGLDYATAYVYRVDAVNSVGTTAGTVVSFTTATPIEVSTIIRLTSGSDGTLMTGAALSAETLGTGTVTTTPDPMTDVAISTEQVFTAYAVKLSDGSGIGTTGQTRSIKVNNTANTQRMSIEFPTDIPLVSVGFPIRLGTGFGTTAFSTDFVVIESGSPHNDSLNPVGSTNDFATINWHDSSRLAKAHTIAGKDGGLNVPSNNKWYWATLLWDAPNLISRVRFYDTTTQPWTLVDSESTLALRSYLARRLRYGHVDNTSGFIAAPHWFGDLLIDTAGKWPLLPAESGVSVEP